MVTKLCKYCSAEFQVTNPAKLYCNKVCRDANEVRRGVQSTENQYKRQSGDWRQYYLRRISEKGRRDNLTAQDLLDIHAAQGGLCALSGVPLTCDLVKGVRSRTNASVDRKIPGGPYTKDNIQLVCSSVNLLRGMFTVEEYVDWCKKVVTFQEKKHGDESKG